MSEEQGTNENWIGPSKSQVHKGWRIMASREMTDLWVGWRLPIILILFSISLGVTSFLLATNVELSLIPPREMVLLILQIALAVGILMGLILGADSISGERERATLEGLLLTPASRNDILIGKYIASVSPWPFVLAVSSAYLAVLATNGISLFRVLLWGAVVGSLLVLAFTGLGIIVSTWSRSNKSSLSIGLIIYLLFLIPTQFPGSAKAGALGQLIQRLNPVEAGNHFLTSVIVNNKPVNEMSGWLLTPVLFAVIAWIMLLGIARSGLKLEIDRPFLAKLGQSAKITLLMAVLSLFGVTQTKADQVSNADQGLSITTGMVYNIVRTGDAFTFQTVVKNDGTQESPSLLVAINIVKIGEGEPADPEDWSPERTQFVSSMASGETATLDWTIHAIIQGSYFIYVAAIPQPDAPQSTSDAVTGQAIHLTVTPYLRLNPGGILAIALGMPVGLSLCFIGIQLRRRKQIDPENS